MASNRILTHKCPYPLIKDTHFEHPLDSVIPCLHVQHFSPVGSPVMSARSDAVPNIVLTLSPSDDTDIEGEV